MFYAITSFLALVLNLIINWDSLKNLRGRPGEAASEQKVTFRYNLFLIASNFYFFADICWGLLYENRHIDALFPFLMDYRIIAFKKTHYVRMTVQKTADETHYIIGIENINDEVKKEKQHLKALNTEKELARRDELTGVKNKTAYKELEKSVQSNIDNGMDYLPFGLVVCDANYPVKGSRKSAVKVWPCPCFRNGCVYSRKRYSCNRNLRSRRQGNVQKQAES